MTYEDLMRGITYTGALPAGYASFVAQDSRKVTPGAVFVCVNGRTSDGHNFAQKALDAGAGLVVTQRALGLANEVLVADTRAAYAALSANYFGRPAENLVLVGVTGTNGKTTVSSVLKQVLQANGHSCGLIGTICSEVGGVNIPARFTTPEAWELNALLSSMAAAGCTHVVMEASSQALEQGRLLGLRFALGVFTNLTQDHLDYHGDMENYFKAKKILFSQCDAILANRDDAYGLRLLNESDCAVKKSFSDVQNEADFMAHGVDLRAGEVRFAFLGDGFLLPVKFPIPGAYSVHNALAAGASAVMLGCEPRQTAVALEEIHGVPGRCEVLYSGLFTVICDFAHTGDAVEKLLASLRPFVRGRMVVLFGCAGQRDATKRPVMATAALRYSDVIVLTADNPREESLEHVNADVLPPLQSGGKPFFVIEERTEAVRFALDQLEADDMLVLCGKGHEDYQVLDGVTVYLNEGQIVREWLDEKEL